MLLNSSAKGELAQSHSIRVKKHSEWRACLAMRFFRDLNAFLNELGVCEYMFFFISNRNFENRLGMLMEKSC